MSLSGSPAGLRSHLVMGLLTVSLTAAVVYVAGLMVLPGDTTSEPAGGIGAALPVVGDLSGSQAVVVVSGERDERIVMNRLRVGEYNENVALGDPLRLSLTYRSGHASLLVSAIGIALDAPVAGERAAAIFQVEGGSYYGNNGECTVSLESVDYVVLEPMPAVQDGVPRGMPIPVYAGVVECQSVKDIRSDALVDLYAVFQYLPEE